MQNDGSDLVSGSFASIITQPGITASVNYNFAGVDALSRVGTGNDIAVTITPEPASLSFLGVALLAIRRRRSLRYSAPSFR